MGQGLGEDGKEYTAQNIPAIPLCICSASQVGCPPAILESASGAAYVQEISQADLFYCVFPVSSQQVRSKTTVKLEAWMQTAAQKKYNPQTLDGGLSKLWSPFGSLL